MNVNKDSFQSQFKMCHIMRRDFYMRRKFIKNLAAKITGTFWYIVKFDNDW